MQPLEREASPRLLDALVINRSVLELGSYDAYEESETPEEYIDQMARILSTQNLLFPRRHAGNFQERYNELLQSSTAIFEQKVAESEFLRRREIPSHLIKTALANEFILEAELHLQIAVSNFGGVPRSPFYEPSCVIEIPPVPESGIHQEILSSILCDEEVVRAVLECTVRDGTYAHSNTERLLFLPMREDVDNGGSYIPSEKEIVVRIPTDVSRPQQVGWGFVAFVHEATHSHVNEGTATLLSEILATDRSLTSAKDIGVDPDDPIISLFAEETDEPKILARVLGSCLAVSAAQYIDKYLGTDATSTADLHHLDHNIAYQTSRTMTTLSQVDYDPSGFPTLRVE